MNLSDRPIKAEKDRKEIIGRFLAYILLALLTVVTIVRELVNLTLFVR
jgi:hypothetical protein